MHHVLHIEEQPRWRVAIIAALAKLIGVRIHVEGYPLGSNRNWKPKARASVVGSAKNP